MWLKQAITGLNDSEFKSKLMEVVSVLLNLEEVV